MKKKINDEHRFKIDFIELAFLAEACIPERPIARSMFWDRLCDDIYHELTVEERARLFEWIQKNPSFSLDKEDCQYFYDRFNPQNQVTITTSHKGVIKDYECFMHKGQYQISKTTSILEQYIVK